MIIGVLALQGAFYEHILHLNSLQINTREIRNKQDLESIQFDGFIIPGGESTTMGRLLHELDLYTPLKSAIEAGVPVFGTCAGMILLAKHIFESNRTHLATMDINVVRNGYGRQLGSFTTLGSIATSNTTEPNIVYTSISDFPMVFIRAPYIREIGPKVSILATIENKIVAVRQDNMLACSFHPELTKDLRLHNYFIDMIKNNNKRKL